MNSSIIALAVLASAAAAHAQTGRYYVTDESGFNQVWQFQGGALVGTFPTNPAGGADGPIIVDGNTNTVRSVKGGFIGGAAPSFGTEYNFAGVPVGAPGSLSLNPAAQVGYGRVIDAAFDGTNTYIVHGFSGTAGVFQYGANFSGAGTLMFNITGPNASTAQGITYDTLTQTIWTSDYDFGVAAGQVRQWNAAGQQINSFLVVNNAGQGSERNTALAYDQSDDTFWMNAHVENSLGFGIGELWQFSRNGTFLQSIHAQQTNPNAPANILYWGGEIFLIPTPSAAALLGLGGLVALRRRR